MLLKLTLLLSAICVISHGQTVEIECSSGEICLVERLPADLPAGATWKFLCPQDCTQIEMHNVNFPRFPREIWLTHPDVTELHLDGTDFEELASGDFFNAAKLITFALMNNKRFMSLRDNCFSGASAVTSFDLYNNKINELGGDAFNGISRLSRLEMENNNVSYISNRHFQNLPNLRRIDFFSNTIETIESDAFLHNAKLDYLKLDSNNLQEVDLLLPFINTVQISIYSNQITKVALRSTLQEIGDFDPGTMLFLDNNKLTELSIQPNIAVEQLTLWENPIERIDTLPALRSLKVLGLQGCAIRSLDGQRFADKYVNLETLRLTGNSLISFSRETFAGLDKLKTLVLDVNGLTRVDFPRLASLTYLDVRNNSLTEFPYGANIRDTFPVLEDLDIRNNNFDAGYLATLVKTLEDQGIFVEWEPVPWMLS